MKVLTLRYDCRLPAGLHARPAAAIEAECRRFAAAIVWKNLRNGRRGSAKSVLALLGTDTLAGDSCALSFSGPDAEPAHRRIADFLANQLTDAVSADLPCPPEAGPAVPRPLAVTGSPLLRGRAVSPGLASGTLLLLPEDTFPHPAVLPGVVDGPGRLRAAREALAARMREEIARADGPVAGILEAQLALLDAPEFTVALAAATEGVPTLADAVHTVEAHYRALFARSASAALRDRALDVRDLCQRLLAELYPAQACPPPMPLATPSVVLADELTPSRFLSLDRGHLRALLLGRGGGASHTVILARAFGIPVLTGIDMREFTPFVGRPVIVDAESGVVVPAPNEAARRYYAGEESTLRVRQARLAAGLARPACSADGQRLEIAANISSADEAAAAFARGADGIGLFRTEFLLMDRLAPPDEDEQTARYAEVVAAAAGRPVIIRTFDFGGDKPVPYLPLSAEANPFFGSRGVRLYRRHEDLFRTQVRALLRAAATGPLKLMVPMVQQPDEVGWVRQVIAEEERALAKAAVPHAPQVGVGIMLEVPAVAWLIDQFAPLADFFSIGSNDLTQYLLAMDRNSPARAARPENAPPALLRLLRRVCDEIHAQGRRVGLCGELGSDPEVLPLLVGAGLDAISLTPPAIPAAKVALAELDAARCRALLGQALQCPDAAAIRTLVAAASVRAPQPLVSEACIWLDCDWRSKEEAIHGMVGRLWAAGRASARHELEAALWQREELYSTGLGYGIAIPHARAGAADPPTISIARLRAPVEWRSLDGAPVHTLIMLTLGAAQAGERHLRVFSRLARSIMHENFRTRLVAAGNPAAMAKLMVAELNEIEGADA